MEKDAIIVLSGGMDSVTLLYEYKDCIALAVTFDYGSNHNRREAEYARMHCERLGIKHLLIPLSFMGQYFKSSLLEGADAIPEGNYDDENMKSTVVPFRNGITVFAPYTGITKTDIARHGKELGLNYAETYSCYKGGEKHCGKCGTCRERIEALRDAGIPDPTEYEE